MTTIYRSLSIIAAFFLLSSFSINSANAQAVGPDGSFNYQIEIKLPPGTAGMAPKLALLYNSNSENGIAGMGWNLSGLPYITRDTSFAINYNTSDTYTGENGRLVHVSGNVYHYKEETFSRLEAYGAQGDGPLYWIETKPDGTKLYYGYDPDNNNKSRVEALTHSPSVRAWALSRVEDVHGNYYTVKYIQDEGEFYPLKIVYTQGNGLSSYRTVEFEYISRSDHYKNYTYSTSVETRSILKWIKIKTGVIIISGYTFFGSQTRKYRLDYSAGSSTGRSRLSRVQEFGSDDGELHPIEFSWQEGTSGFQDEGAWISESPYGGYDEYPSHVRPMDANGDGLDDIVIGPSGSGGWFVLRSNGSSFIDDWTWINGAYANWFNATNRIRPMDVNGDGLPDIVLGPDGDGNWFV